MAKTTLVATVINLLFPLDCAACGQESDWLCDSCIKQYRVRLSNCFICAQTADSGVCDSCRTKTGLDGIISIFPYSDPAIRGVIRQAKYHGNRSALEFFAKKFRAKVLRLLPEDIELLTFTPSTREKEKERGYNPAEVLARALAAGEVPVVGLFEKTRDTVSQTKLTKKKRLKNVRGAYRLAEKSLPETLVIVDDVITTGATLGTLARLAKQRKTQAVWVVTVAHG